MSGQRALCSGKGKQLQLSVTDLPPCSSAAAQEGAGAKGSQQLEPEGQRPRPVETL